MKIRYKRVPPAFGGRALSAWFHARLSDIDLPEAEECFGGYWRVDED